MDHFETFEGGRWVPYFALCLFAGIRLGVPHGEITKLKADAVNLEAGIIAAPEESNRHGLRQHLPAWTRRSLAASEHARLHETFAQHDNRNATRSKNQLMSTLKEIIQQRRAAELPSSRSCDSAEAPVRALQIHSWNGDKWVLPWTHFSAARHQGTDETEHAEDQAFA
jgi:hypothetical protein